MTTTPNLPPLPDDGYPSTMDEIHKIERARRPTVKIEPGSEMHMIGIMSQWHLNFVVGRDREHLVAYGKAAYQAGKQAAAAPWPTHEFAIVIDRMYEGEGPSLATWNGLNYQFSDGDCYTRDPDGTLDGYTAEWLTHYQLEQRLLSDTKGGV